MLAPGSIQITLWLLVTYYSIEVIASSMCPAGYLCAGNSQGPCLAGHYCPTGSSIPSPCPVGTYNPWIKGQSMTDCNMCPPGMYCDAMGLAAPTGYCDAGYYCQEGSVSPHPGPCPEGHYCPPGSTFPTPCPVGYYRREVKGQFVTDCSICPPGMYCAGVGPAAPSGYCDAGFYCREGSPTSIQGRCPEGHYCPTGSSIPSPCPLGTYRHEVKGQSVTDCNMCPPGMYCAGVGLPVPNGYCDAGYYCYAGSSSPQPDGSDVTGGLCPAGYYCPKGSAMPIACAVGTYTSLIGQSSCSVCPTGHFCPLQGATVPMQCPAGYYSDITGQTTCILCPVGHYCPVGSTSPAQCPSTFSCAFTGLVTPKI